MALEDDAGRLFDLLANSPEGITWQDAADEFGWRHRSYFFRVVRALRLILSDSDREARRRPCLVGKASGAAARSLA